MLDETGTVLSVLGISITFVAYLEEHRGRGLADLEPWLAKGWRRMRSWLQIRLGMAHDATVHGGSAHGHFESSGSASGTSWDQVQPDDDLETRLRKTVGNVDVLSARVAKQIASERNRATEVEAKLLESLHRLTDDIRASDELQREIETRAMRWQVRGLAITLLGTLIGIWS
jgi:hypothetical protein